LGEVLPGGEVLSLSRAFLAAGAQEVVAALWAVYDKPLQFFLQYFYSALRDHHDAPTALALAQRSMIHSGPSGDVGDFNTPFHWAAFHVLGAGSSSSRSGNVAILGVSNTSKSA
jgi:CHAT domain-containing protein